VPTEPTPWSSDRLELGDGARWVDGRLVLVDLLTVRLLETTGDAPAGSPHGMPAGAGTHRMHPNESARRSRRPARLHRTLAHLRGWPTVPYRSIGIEPMLGGTFDLAEADPDAEIPFLETGRSTTAARS